MPRQASKSASRANPEATVGEEALLPYRQIKLCFLSPNLEQRHVGIDLGDRPANRGGDDEWISPDSYRECHQILTILEVREIQRWRCGFAKRGDLREIVE